MVLCFATSLQTQVELLMFLLFQLLILKFQLEFASLVVNHKLFYYYTVYYNSYKSVLGTGKLIPTLR